MPKTALELFLQAEYFGDFTVSSYTPTIVAAPAVILQHSYERLSYVVVNVGNADLYLSIGPSPNAGTGIVLGANGGSMSVNAKEDLAIPGTELYGWCPVGATSCLIQAVERYKES